MIQGKVEVIQLTLLCLLAEGHLLVEDVPGVGKTSLAKALAASIKCTFGRVQFTPDLLPSDVVGVNVFNRETSDFEFRPGPIFANIVLGDEINRASPKTQSALLEAMAENQVTVDGTTYRLESPFMVIATQNPIEHEGTYPLPESQLDRFLMRISIGYPAHDAELEMLDTHGDHDALDDIGAVVSVSDLQSMIALDPHDPSRTEPEGVPRRAGRRDSAPPASRGRDVAAGLAQPAARGAHARRGRRSQLCRARRHQGAGRDGSRAPPRRHAGGTTRRHRAPPT